MIKVEDFHAVFFYYLLIKFFSNLIRLNKKYLKKYLRKKYFKKGLFILDI